MPDRTDKAVIFVVGAIAVDSGELPSQLSTSVGRALCFTRGGAFLEHIATEFDGELEACLLLDLSLEDMPCQEVIAALQRRGCHLPAIIVTSQADVRSAVRAMQAGAIDLFERPIAWDGLLSCIRDALGQRRRGQAAQSRREDARSRWNCLSLGERAVARMVCDGMASREIGAALGLGRRTIENRRANIMNKMGVANVAQLVRLMCGVGSGFPPPEGEPTATSASRGFAVEGLASDGLVAVE